MNIKFEKKENTRANKFYISVMFEGGDADTDHPEEYEMQGITFYNYKEHLDTIKSEVEKYKKLKDILEEYSQARSPFDEILEEYGEDMASLYENTPNDPQCDYQFKCHLSSIVLTAYDSDGNKYQSYVR